MLLSADMESLPKIIAVIGPTASGKSARAVALAKELNGEVISVDSRQVYRTLDIGTEKTSFEEMAGIPHHLIDIREPEETYSAGDFVQDAEALITDMHARGITPILAGGTHFYFEALLYGLPPSLANPLLRTELEKLSADELFTELQTKDSRRAERIDPKNKRRLVRALEIIAEHGSVPERTTTESKYDVEWVIIDPSKEELRPRIDARLQQALDRGLVDEVRAVRARVGDARLNEFGLEYRIIGEYLREERSEASLLPALSTKLWHYARHQKAWLRKLSV
ncbi:MAG: tRNA dimethylallyltransferase [Parcubacteria group bacterium]|nr:tRNA dimethylallyltransferase [Parcubacteria group bacterium]